ncbi:MAG: hypothetical protein N3B18_03025 [Desulfobacterota bacterium]|nr:hypothetical protein [Thermodesulfobacteriota bacterium]
MKYTTDEDALVFDGVYCAAYIMFLTGAACAFSGWIPAGSLWLMAGGITVDFFATVIPNSGCKSLAINIGTHPLIIVAISICVMVWLLFLGAVFVHLMGRSAHFFVMIVITKVLWFLDLVLFFYGVYALHA